MIYKVFDYLGDRLWSVSMNLLYYTPGVRYTLDWVKPFGLITPYFCFLRPEYAIHWMNRNVPHGVLVPIDDHSYTYRFNELPDQQKSQIHSYAMPIGTHFVSEFRINEEASFYGWDVFNEKKNLIDPSVLIKNGS
jgi:hypothetical protein